jgi:hypothetical protein
VKLSIQTLMLWGCIAPAAAMAAPFTTSVNVSTSGNGVNVGGVIVTPSCEQNQSGSGSLSFRCATEGNTANATAGPGYLQVSAFSEVVSFPNARSGGGARAQASFSDTLSFDAPTLAGKTVTVTGRVIIDGVLSTQVSAGFGGALATWTGYGGALGKGIVNSGSRQEYAGGAVPPPDTNVNGWVFPIVSDLQFDAKGHAESSVALTMIVIAQSNVNGAGSASAGAAFANTAYWSGIDRLTLNGLDFSGDYTVTSASGANYRFATSPVPEAATMWMMASGLALLAGLKLRRV